MADTKSLKSAVDIGREAFLSGDLDRARECYLQELSERPENAEVLHALSTVEMHAGQLDTAEKHIRKAIGINRYGVGFQNSLGNLLVKQDRPREAEAAYFEELRMRPEFALSHNQLGCLMLRTGNLQRAVKHFQSALQFSSDYGEAANNLGLALLRDKQYGAAGAALERALVIDDKSGQAHANLGHVKLALGETTEAAGQFERAFEVDPRCASAIRGMAHIRLVQGKVQDAIAAYNNVLEIDPEDIESVRALAEIWERQGVWETAEQYYRTAHTLAPNNLDVLNHMASLQVSRGRFDAAIESYEKALQIRPSDQISLAGYGRLKAMTGDTKLAMSKLSALVQSGRADSGLLSAYARLLGASKRRREGITLLEQRLRTRIPDDEKRKLYFTLGDLLDADGSYDLAFHNYRQANRLKGVKFDSSRFTILGDRIIQAFDAQAMEMSPRAGTNGEGIVFLIGMPRAGVKVTERQLRQHDEVVSNGNNPFVEMSAYRLTSEHGMTWPARADQYEFDVLTRFASLYHDRARLQGDAGDVTLDATWRNFLYLGLIELMFPKAQIVYCARDYRDIALSCFFTDFDVGGGSSAFAYNLHDIATYINTHKKIMNHWNDVLTLPMHVVSYERMILDYDSEIASLFGFLGLSNPTVASAIDAQDRLPKPSSLKSTSLRRYRHYKQHLESLVEELESDPDRVY